jgi:tetratricopeptide (TPR) repeat protein
VLAAQQPSDRALLDQFRDSLAHTSDGEALASLEEGLIEVAKRDRDNPLIHLKLGFVALRLGEVLGISHSRKGTKFDHAASEFEWAAELEPDWPYPWYGLGLAELGMSYLPPTGAETLRQHLGKDHQSNAANAFARAVEADPSYVPALTLLTEVALAQKIKPKHELALGAARRAATSGAQHRPEVHLARARLEREVGSSDSSLVALQAYVATGGDPAIARFESAQALYDLGHDADGKDAYFDGAGSIVTTDARRLYRSDMEWIADSAELRSYDLEEVGALRAWLTHFWTRRDVAAGRRPGERLAEHRRRQNHALRNYRRIGSLEFLPALYDPPISTILRGGELIVGQGGDTPAAGIQQPGEVPGQGIVDLTLRQGANPVTVGACGSERVDARGVIYVRHGEPDDIAFAGGQNVRPNVSWKYERPGEEPLLFHFMQPFGASDYCLYVLPDLIPGVLASRAGLSSMFQTLGSRASIDRAASRGWRDMAEGLTTDSYRQRFSRDLEPVTRAYALSDPTSQGSRLLLAYALPGHRLESVSERESGAYRVNIRALVSTERDSLVTFADSLRMFRYRRELERGQFLIGAEQFALPVGRYHVRLIVAQEAEAAGGSADLAMVDLPDFRRPRLSMSDLVLGREGLGILIFNGRDSIPVDPLNTYPAGGRVDLYYEVAGIAGGTPYTTEIQLVAIEDGDDEAAVEGRAPDITLSFSEAAEAPFTRVRRRVDLGALQPGQYRLRVRVTDSASGTSRRQDTTIAVVE